MGEIAYNQLLAAVIAGDDLTREQTHVAFTQLMDGKWTEAQVAGLLVALAAKGETADEIAHVECFDEEQRSEVYAILQALKSDTEAHQLMVNQLIEQIKGGSADA